ncbi:hypothetical protein [Streptomyces sp. VNUA24]|uniref:hypothetical protein n=1 Tax=Streptomyces sp. VNUA24 TaxID=3031131 RepID=UPI0023B87B38|nr:hypothetical protein [Streptomyces sp. VNUA24]WEH19913.1 hypothetical protein PYR72_42085 [Streptomyces sp. VNUA24]
MVSVVTANGSTQLGSLIDEIVREGGRWMLAAALEAGANQYIAELAAETDAADKQARWAAAIDQRELLAAGPAATAGAAGGLSTSWLPRCAPHSAPDAHQQAC